MGPTAILPTSNEGRLESSRIMAPCPRKLSTPFQILKLSLVFCPSFSFRHSHQLQRYTSENFFVGYNCRFLFRYVLISRMSSMCLQTRILNREYRGCFVIFTVYGYCKTSERCIVYFKWTVNCIYVAQVVLFGCLKYF